MVCLIGYPDQVKKQILASFVPLRFIISFSFFNHPACPVLFAGLCSRFIRWNNAESVPCKKDSTGRQVHEVEKLTELFLKCLISYWLLKANRKDRVREGRTSQIHQKPRARWRSVTDLRLQISDFRCTVPSREKISLISQGPWNPYHW